METFNILSDYSLLESPEDYEQAAVSRNPLVTWIKGVFTDNIPNGNNKRIQKEEFSNVIRTGVHMPIKMQAGNHNGDHEFSRPIGVITNLVEQENKVVFLAALWKEEYPEDIEMLEKAYAANEPLKLSWEVYPQSRVVDDSGVEDLKGVTVRATTFVGNPAYMGRTNVVAMAEIESTKENKNLDKIQELEAKIAELSASLEQANKELSAKVTETDSVNSELTTLREYKSQREAEDNKNQLVASRKAALTEAGVNLTDDEFSTRAERIISMDDTTFGFYVQELVAFSSRNTVVTPEGSGNQNPTIPDVSSSTSKDPKAILLGAIK